ncbi:MAG: hypothetical protein LBJ75_00730 [Puniceicoccales bacterium]|jgi:hypothetical protein|nr:hypothetical protein [Puniceicoccales bacterium]
MEKFLLTEGQAVPTCAVESNSVMNVSARVPLGLPEYSIEVTNGEDAKSFGIRIVQGVANVCKVLVDT